MMKTQRLLLTLLGAISFSSLYAHEHKDLPGNHPCSLKDPNFERGDEAIKVCNPSYTPPAQVHLKRAYQGFISTSYLYWDVEQEGMDLAKTATYTGSLVELAGITSKTIAQDSGYHSGFKVGLGYNFEACDNWTLRADYTRLHQKTTSTASAPSSSTGTGVFLVTDWFFQQNNTQLPAAQSLHSSWSLDLDWLDITLSRAFYQGQRFIMTPFASLRTSWIAQSLNLSLENIINGFSASSGSSSNHSHSWGIGPRLGTQGRFLLGAGFRLQAEIGGSLLFTHYNSISHSESDLNGNGPISYKWKNYTFLRPMLESNLGLGWGTYLSKQRYHIDLSATYDFNYLWGQNMMRTLNDIYALGSSASSYALSLQGLTITAAFTF